MGQSIPTVTVTIVIVKLDNDDFDPVYYDTFFAILILYLNNWIANFVWSVLAFRTSALPVTVTMNSCMDSLRLGPN
jgi:hypothetical protein